MSIDTFSGFRWATPLPSEKSQYVIQHLLEAFNVMGVPQQIKTDNAPAYLSKV